MKVASVGTLLVVLAQLSVSAQIISYEATSFPEETDSAWIRYEVAYPAQRWIDNGSLFQLADQVQPPSGPSESEQDVYYRSLSAFSGADSWFVQWRMITNGPSSAIPAASPSFLSAGGFSGILYHVTIAEDKVRLIRDVQLPIIWTDIAPGVPHTYRLELHGAQSYALFIDSSLFDSGVPEGTYPTTDSTITFGSNAPNEPATTRWDYIRFGRIAHAHSGDFDSNSVVDQADLYFFVDCLLGPDYDAAGPGCKFADMNADGVANGGDIQQFVDAMIAA